MRKSLWGWIGVTAMLLLLPVPVQAKEKQKDKPAASVVDREKAMREAKAAEALSNTVWSAEFSPLSGEKPKKPVKDTLTFQGSKVSSESLSRDGYTPTNYTVTVPDESTVIWETMQTKEGGGVVFWRGERQQDSMRGILSKHPEKGAAVDYSFSANLMGEKPAAAAAPAAAAVKQPATAAAASSQVSASKQAPAPPPQTTEKKKGWW